jgi:hypothetical protein
MMMIMTMEVLSVLVPFAIPDRLVARMPHGPRAASVLEEFGFAYWPSALPPWLGGGSFGFGTVERWHLEVPWDELVRSLI